MDKAKETVKKFMSNDGKHDTTVHEKVNPAVQNETITRQEHERQTTAVDREVHQDHYHTTEQPIHHTGMMAEQHHHNAQPVEHRSYEHDNADKNRSLLDEQQKKYFDTQQRVEGQKSQSHEGTVQGEHMHHHVHETIQPVVNKQTVEPHVVHTTVPIHEVHHNEAHHHSSTQLPPMSMDEYKKAGGGLSGRETQQTRHEFGEPQSIGGHSVRNDRGPVAGTTDHSGSDGRTKEAMTERIGTDSRTNPTSGHDNYSSGSYGQGTPIADKMGSSGYGSSTGRQGTDGGLPGSTSDSHKFGTMDGGSRDGTSSTEKKPSMMDKLNPKVDATGDGKAGFMK